MGFDEFAFSLRMRDTIDKMIQVGVDRLRPKYRYATVDSIDRENYKCTVTFNGETNPVEVSMGSIQPSAVGQVVRIDGLGTDKFISDVIGVPYFNQSSLLSALAINKGGTGATTAAAARTALGITPANIGATYAGHSGNLSDLDDWDQYPSGYSVAYFSNPAGAPPGSAYGTVVTHKAVSSRTFQMAHANQSDAVYTRYYYNGSWGAWQRLAQEGQHGIPFAMAAGAVAISFSNQAVSSASVTFPAGRFTATPVVTLTQVSLQGGSGLLIPKVLGTSTSGFTAYAYTGNAANTTVSNVSFHWTAVQMSATTGVG